MWIASSMTIYRPITAHGSWAVFWAVLLMGHGQCSGQCHSQVAGRIPGHCHTQTTCPHTSSIMGIMTRPIQEVLPPAHHKNHHHLWEHYHTRLWESLQAIATRGLWETSPGTISIDFYSMGIVGGITLLFLYFCRPVECLQHFFLA